jgi:hypothetical protein
MHEGVDRAELTVHRSAVERHHDAGNGSLPQADANEMPGKEIESIWDEVTEGAGGAADAREDGDLRGPRGHRS